MTDLAIPEFLKIDADARRQAWEGVKLTSADAAAAIDYSAQFKARQLRKLRAEERRLSNLIDEIGAHDQAARRRLYDAIKVVETEIAKVEQ